MTSLPSFRTCAGFIVFDSKECKRTILVTTPTTKTGGGGNQGFPKGKLKEKETLIQGAGRELEEETKLTPDQLVVYFKGDSIHSPLPCVIEFNDRGNISVQYYPAYMKNPNVKLEFQDPEELAKVELVPVSSLH